MFWPSVKVLTLKQGFLPTNQQRLPYERRNPSKLLQHMSRDLVAQSSSECLLNWSSQRWLCSRIRGTDNQGPRGGFDTSCTLEEEKGVSKGELLDRLEKGWQNPWPILTANADYFARRFNWGLCRGGRILNFWSSKKIFIPQSIQNTYYRINLYLNSLVHLKKIIYEPVHVQSRRGHVVWFSMDRCWPVKVESCPCPRRSY